jgi:hypothetical protein
MIVYYNSSSPYIYSLYRKEMGMEDFDKKEYRGWEII